MHSGPGAEPAPILMLEWSDSTNAEVRRRAEAGETGPQWIAARRQIAGHGRRGRAWTMGEGDLAATLLTVTDRPPAEAAQVSFVAALTVADLVQAYAPTALVQLKWPNDVMVEGEKIAGILIESGRRDDGRLWLAVGVGVNLTGAPQDLDQPATSLARHGAAPDPQTALSVLSERFSVWLRIWQDFGFAPIAEAWSQRAMGLGEPCVARLGAETVHGTAEGLDGDGALKLRLADGNLRRISAGDVFFGKT